MLRGVKEPPFDSWQAARALAKLETLEISRPDQDLASEIREPGTA